MILLMLLCLSTTLFAAEQHNDASSTDLQVLRGSAVSAQDMACQVPLQTLKMAKGAISGRVDWLLQQDDTYLAEKISAEERSAALEHLEWEAHKNYSEWVREHDCGIMSTLACAIGCPTLLGLALGGRCVGGELATDLGGFAGLAIGGLAGACVSYHYQPDQTEIKCQIARLKVLQEKKQKTE